MDILKKLEEAEAVIDALPTITIVPRPKPAVPVVTETEAVKPAAYRSLADEVRRDTKTAKLLSALAEKKDGLAEAMKERDDAAKASFEEQIKVVIGVIRVNPTAYAAYLAERMTLGEAHEVIDDLIARGILREVDEAEKKKNKEEDWPAYNAKLADFETKKAEYDAMYGAVVEKGDEEADIPEAPRPPAKPQTIWSLPVITGNTRSYRYFAKRYFAKDEPRPEGYDPKVADTLIGAWVRHVGAEKRFRADKAEDRSKLLTELREKFKPVEGKTITDIDAGFVGVVEVVLKPEHGYKDMWTDRALEGSIFVGGLGVDGVGIAKGKILGAVGSVWPGLSRLVENTERGQQATLFQWKTRYSFDGIQAVEDGRALNFLRVLLCKAGELGGQKQSPANDLRQYKPQTRRGHRSDEDQGPRKAKGRKNGKGGRGRRDSEDSE